MAHADANAANAANAANPQHVLRFRHMPSAPEFETGDFRMHLQKLELIFALQHENENRTKKSLAYVSLKGQAEVKASGLIADITDDNVTYDMFKDRLLRIFCPPAHSEIALTDFYSLKQKKNDDFMAYVAMKRQYFQRAFAVHERIERTLILETIKGIYNITIRQKLDDRTDEFQTLDQMAEKGLQLIASARRQVANGYGRQNNLDGLHNVEAFQPGKSGNQRKKETRKCFNCDKTGHLAKNCRLPKKNNNRGGNKTSNGGGNKKGSGGKKDEKRACHKCYTPGHLKKDCRIPDHKLEATRQKNKKKNKGRISEVDPEENSDEEAELIQMMSGSLN